jgi:hyperosmotically inducible periplasmic protein
MRKFARVLAALCLVAGLCLAAGKPVNDDTITNQVMLKLSGDPVVKGGNLKVDVKDGVVTITGAVMQDKQKDRATKLAKKVKGVREVVNNITIQERPAAR